MLKSSATIGNRRVTDGGTAAVEARRVGQLSHPSHREAQRRYRRRQASGRVVVTLEFTPEETAKLHRLHYLAECELEDRARIAAALHLLLANILDV
jgi:hypothetical protein